ncbi:MAG: PAS domain-containing sensor histidine kinase [Hyphomicrobiales bacterium]
MPQQRLAQVIELSDLLDQAIFVLEVQDDDRLVFRKLNRFHEKATGLKSQDLAGKTPFEVLPPRMAESVNAKYLACLTSRASFTYEEVLSLPNGEIWWQTTLSPLIFDDGRVIGIVGTAVDITDRKKQEFRDANALAELRKLNEEINTYASMAAHDVRGPLRKIKVITELMFVDGVPPADEPITLAPDQRILLESIGSIANSTLDHVDSILSYARALSLPDEAKLEEIDLHLLFADLVGLVDAGGAFHFDYPRQTVLAERVILQVTLRNLLENAVKFGRSHCIVRLEESEGYPGFLEFTASDDGPGFAKGATLFGQSARSQSKSPTNGFGLASAQRMIEARGGRMWLAEGEGGAHVAFTTRGKLLKPA